MNEQEHDLTLYDDLLAGLERLANGLDEQNRPLPVKQIDWKNRPRTIRLQWIRPLAWAAAAAVLLAVGFGIWLALSASQNGTVGRNVIATSGPVKAAPALLAASQSADSSSEVISLVVPAVSMPSLTADNSATTSSAVQDSLAVPSMPTSESVEVKFEIPSITFPTLTERSSDES